MFPGPLRDQAANLATVAPTVNVTGPIRFEFRKTVGGTNRINLDDFQITGF